MHPPIKDQSKLDIDNPELDASHSEENRDMTDQSFKDESDINYMLSRFGITQPRGAPQYGTWDDSIDLQMAIESVREARAGYDTLPKELREKFPSMEYFLRSVDNGSLVLKDAEPATSEPAPPAPAPTQT